MYNIKIKHRQTHEIHILYNIKEKDKHHLNKKDMYKIHENLQVNCVSAHKNKLFNEIYCQVYVVQHQKERQTH